MVFTSSIIFIGGNNKAGSYGNSLTEEQKIAVLIFVV